jgi:hypothetical protein
MGATIIKPLHGSMEWLKLRHRDDTGWPVVSASDAAAVHGEHRFKTKYGLGIDKLADEPVVTETNRAMERGNRLEATLLNWVGDEIGERVFHPDRMYVFQERGASMVATLDGYTGSMSPRLIVDGMLQRSQISVGTSLSGSSLTIGRQTTTTSHRSLSANMLPT